MSTWIKLHSSLPQSSIWMEAPHVRIVWISLLAVCDLDGIARVSEVAAPNLANLPKDQCDEALRVLSSPDPSSRSQDWEGRRIERVNGGFRILNYFTYREAQSKAHRAEYMKDYMKRYRSKPKQERTTWKQAYQSEADAAMLVELPMEFDGEVASRMDEFLNYRHSLACKSQRKQDAVRLTVKMVESLIADTKLALQHSNASVVASKLRAAITAGYRSPSFSSLYA